MTRIFPGWEEKLAILGEGNNDKNYKSFHLFFSLSDYSGNDIHPSMARMWGRRLETTMEDLFDGGATQLWVRLWRLDIVMTMRNQTK